MLNLLFKCPGFCKRLTMPVRKPKKIYNRQKCGVDFAYLNPAAGQGQGSVKPMDVLSHKKAIIESNLLSVQLTNCAE